MSDPLRAGERESRGRAATAPAARRPASVTRRRGVVLLATIVCVAIMTVLFVSILKMAGAQHRSLQTRQWQVQAAWLAESALERAAWRLGADPGYAGETWALSAEQLDAQRPAVVRIKVETLPDQPGRRMVRVRADYPDHPRHRARVSKQTVMRVPQSEGEER